MKMPQSLFKTLRDGYKIILEHIGGAAKVKEHYQSLDMTCKRMIYDLFWQVNFDLRYDDTHPAYTAGEWEVDGVMQPRPARIRKLPHDPNYGPELDKLYDTHIETGLKMIAKEFGLLFEPYNLKAQQKAANNAPQ